MIQSALNETGEFNARPAFTGLRLSSITEWVLALDVMEQRRLASMFIEGVIKVNGGDFPRRLLWWLLRGGHISSARFPLYWFFFPAFFFVGCFFEGRRDLWWPTHGWCALDFLTLFHLGFLTGFTFLLGRTIGWNASTVVAFFFHQLRRFIPTLFRQLLT